MLILRALILTLTVLLLLLFWPPTESMASSEGSKSQARSRARVAAPKPQAARGARGGGRSRSSRGRGKNKTQGLKDQRPRGMACQCDLCDKQWQLGMPWGETVSTLVDGTMVTEAVGDLCVACMPVRHSFPLTLENLAEKQEDDEYAPKLKESRARSSGDLPAITEKESVDKHDKLRFEGGRSVILLNASELARLMSRETVPKYAVEGVPVVSMRKENEPQHWEDVYVFPDPNRPHRRGFIGQSQEVVLNTNSMPTSAHLWEGQGEAFFGKASEDFRKETGVLEAMSKKGHQLRPLEDILEKMRKPSGSGADEAPLQVEGDGKRRSRSAAAPIADSDQLEKSPRAESSSASGMSKSVLGLFGLRSNRQLSLVASPEPPAKVPRGNAESDSLPSLVRMDASEELPAPSSPGGQTVASNQSFFDIIQGEDDSSEEYLKKWKK